jgi:SAM-dependent methyltransferase
MERTDYEEIYRGGNPPWEHGEADGNLADAVARFSIQPCNALDLGCGMGNNTIWLAQHGFRVHGLDLSPTAVGVARHRAAGQGVECTLQVGDFLADAVGHAPFGLVFDRGCLHCIQEATDRFAFARKVAGILVEGGLWLSLVGNADEPKREVGPPRLSALELVGATEHFFEILSLESGAFGGHQDDPPRAWVCLLRRRAEA